jgi:uncharacterized membrane protein YobD (UPF0266 family)
VVALLQGVILAGAFVNISYCWIRVPEMLLKKLAFFSELFVYD